MQTPPYLRPFVLPVGEVTRERHDRVDLFLPTGDPPWPAVVLVHGGPLPEALRPTPRDWPVYQGYGAGVATRGAVAATVDHRLHGPTEYPAAAQDVADAVALVRADPRVDADRIALWFFSGGGLLMADWLGPQPAWLRCVAATYPVLGEAGWPVDQRFRPVDALARGGSPPVVLTRVGRERPEFARTVADFVAAADAAGLQLQIIDVPDGQHGFDHLDDTEQSRAAVRQALAAVLQTLTAGP